jgi:MFS transporter, Spinster family, sphingosine-1-phosphate transporter
MNQLESDGKDQRLYKRYLLTLLMLVLAFNFVDRLTLGLVLQNIKSDLKLSDTQLGLMSGIAFTLFYSVMGIPLARWADRGNRITIISMSVALWSVLVAACGIAGNFLQLLLIRVGVGIGEAGCLPPSFSLISDHFDRSERPTASAVYTMGAPLSFLLGYFPAGWLNEAYGWRMTFVVVGLPGVALALLVRFTLKEPRSFVSSRAVASKGAARPVALKDVCITLWKIPTFRRLLLSYSVLFFFSSGLLQWQPTFFLRSYALRSGEVGTWFAVIFGIGGLFGTYMGGKLASRYAKNNERLQLKATSLVYSLLGAASVATYLAPNYQLALVGLSVFAIGMYFTTGPLWATIQTVVPERMRATAIAILYLFANLFGTGFGPLAVGALSDYLAPWAGKESLRYALLIVSPGLIWSAWHIWRSGDTVTDDIELLHKRSSGPLNSHSSVQTSLGH